MRLEHKTEKVIPVVQFTWRMLRFGLFALMLILLSLCMGVIGYHYVADLSWIDSFHMSSMILTGMGPVVEMRTDGAKIFSSVFALYSGIAFLSVTAVFFAPIIHRVLHILHVQVGE